MTANADLTLGSFIESMSPQLSFAKLFEWPPDVFAITSVLLEDTGAYRYSVSPPGRDLPDQLEWGSAVAAEQEGWNRWLDRKSKRLPDRVRKARHLLRSRRAQRLSLDALRKIRPPSSDDDDLPWRVFLAILDLHCIADSAGEDYGLPSGRSPSLRLFFANMLLTTRGTLSRLPRSRVIVLPKTRTPQVGATLRSLSHYLTAHRTEAEVIWRSVPWINRDANTLNVLVVPWPYKIQEDDFEPLPLHYHFGARGGRFFRYRGPSPEDPRRLRGDFVCDLIEEAEKHVARVHLVVFPELALSEAELEDVKRSLALRFATKKVPLVVTGVRSAGMKGSELGFNKVVLSSYFAAKWYDLAQCKHHRWRLESNQLRQYDLKGLFPGEGEWWEAIDIPPRQLTFLSPSAWLTMCPLICEDLARLDPVSPLIRGVGPSLVVAVLMDGPQLRSRWSARYASVLADDPGTSVLTVSSLGMSLRSRRFEETLGDGEGDHPSVDGSKSRRKTVAMWKDITGDWKELNVEPKDHALLLSIRAGFRLEWTCDGRSDNGNAPVFQLENTWRIRIKPKVSPAAGAVDPPPLLDYHPVDLEELSRFTHLVDHIVGLADDREAVKLLLACSRTGGGDHWEDVAEEKSRFGVSLGRAIREDLERLYRQRPATSFLAFIDFFEQIVRCAFSHEEGSFRSGLIDLATTLLDPDSAGELWCYDPLATAKRSLVERCAEAADGRPERMTVLAAIALVWSVHRRLVDVTKTFLDDEERKLLARIESLLKIDYFDRLRDAPSTSESAG